MVPKAVPQAKPAPRVPRPVPVRKPPTVKTSTPKKNKTGKFIFGIFALLLVIVVCAKIVNAFSSVIIKIIPHAEIMEVDTLIKSGKADSYDTRYETMEVTVTKEKSVEAEGTEEVSSKASGRVTIYNAYGSETQNLVANTRFESSDGKIYRIQEKITIPGAKIEGGEIVPSSIDTIIYADKPGKEYNMESGNFKIPGFEGSPRYEKFYAEIKTPVKGGFQGVLPIISEEKQSEMRKELELAIKDELFEKIRMQTPDEFIFYENALQINFVFDENANSVENPKFTLRETGSLVAFLIPREELSNILVKKYLGEDFIGKVKIKKLDKLQFSLVSYDEKEKLIVFKIKGAAEFTWIIEEDKLKNALIARPKEIEEVFKTFSSIDQASIVFKPFWWKFFPEKTSKISIEQNTSK